MDPYDVLNRTTSCPECKEKFVASFSDCKVLSTKVAGSGAENPQLPQPSRLHVAALSDMVEQGCERELRQAAAQVRQHLSDTHRRSLGYDIHGPVDAFMMSRAFRCPNCQAEIKLFLDFTIVSAEPVVRPEGQKALSQIRLKGVDASTLAFVTECRETGVLQAFEEALREQCELKRLQGTPIEGFPSSIGQYFATFLLRAKRELPRNEIFRMFSREQGKQNVQYWQANGVGLVTLDDQIFRFVPAALLENKPQPKAGELHRTLVKQGKSPVAEGEAWVKSRFGYVPLGHQLFMAELLQRSKGAFAKASQ